MTDKISLDLTRDQAKAVCLGLDVFTRLITGQAEIVGHLVRDGIVPLAGAAGTERATASVDVCDRIDGLLAAVKQELGFLANGSNSIGHSHNALEGLRAFETLRVLRSALSLGADAKVDGELHLRYTDDPAPVARVQ